MPFQFRTNAFPLLYPQVKETSLRHTDMHTWLPARLKCARVGPGRSRSSCSSNPGVQRSSCRLPKRLQQVETCVYLDDRPAAATPLQSLAATKTVDYDRFSWTPGQTRDLAFTDVIGVPNPTVVRFGKGRSCGARPCVRVRISPTATSSGMLLRVAATV